MTLKDIAKTAGLLAALTVFPANAHAEGAASGTYQLRARVPMACWVQPQSGSTITGPDASASGAVVEACNNPGGFRVVATYRTLEAGEHAGLRYGGQLIDLPRSGEAVLRQSNMAQIRTIAYAIENASLDQPLVLAFSIQPL